MNPLIMISYELDDNEIVTLLNKTQSVPNQKEGDETISVSRTIRCNRCLSIVVGLFLGGFINPPASTVCRECNSLLKGNQLFTSISRKVY